MTCYEVSDIVLEFPHADVNVRHKTSSDRVDLTLRESRAHLSIVIIITIIAHQIQYIGSKLLQADFHQITHTFYIINIINGKIQYPPCFSYFFLNI